MASSPLPPPLMITSTMVLVKQADPPGSPDRTAAAAGAAAAAAAAGTATTAYCVAPTINNHSPDIAPHSLEQQSTTSVDFRIASVARRCNPTDSADTDCRPPRLDSAIGSPLFNGSQLLAGRKRPSPSRSWEEGSALSSDGAGAGAKARVDRAGTTGNCKHVKHEKGGGEALLPSACCSSQDAAVPITASGNGASGIAGFVLGDWGEEHYRGDDGDRHDDKDGALEGDRDVINVEGGAGQQEHYLVGMPSLMVAMGESMADDMEGSVSQPIMDQVFCFGDFHFMAEEVEKMSKRYPTLHTMGPSTAMPLMGWLRLELDMNLQQMRNLIMRHPRLMAYRVQSHLKPKTDWLRARLGLGQAQLRKLIITYPAVLSRSVEENLEPKLAWLEERLGATPDEVGVLITRFPMLFGYSTSKNLEPTVTFFTEDMAGAREDIKTTVMACPSILSRSLDKRMRPRAEQMRAKGIVPSFDRHKWVISTYTDAQFVRWLCRKNSKPATVYPDAGTDLVQL